MATPATPGFVNAAMRCRESGKCMFSKRDAQGARNARERHGSKPLFVYHCPHCNWWHLTRNKH